MKKLSAKQIEMLESYADANEATDLADFHGHLGWHNRENCINALRNRGLLDDDGVTVAGAEALLSVWKDHVSDHAFRVIADAQYIIKKRCEALLGSDVSNWDVTEEEALEAKRLANLPHQQELGYWQLWRYYLGEMFIRDEAGRALAELRSRPS